MKRKFETLLIIARELDGRESFMASTGLVRQMQKRGIFPDRERQKSPGGVPHYFDFEEARRVAMVAALCRAGWTPGTAIAALRRFDRLPSGIIRLQVGAITTEINAAELDAVVARHWNDRAEAAA